MDEKFARDLAGYLTACWRLAGGSSFPVGNQLDRGIRALCTEGELPGWMASRLTFTGSRCCGMEGMYRAAIESGHVGPLMMDGTLPVMLKHSQAVDAVGVVERNYAPGLTTIEATEFGIALMNAVEAVEIADESGSQIITLSALFVQRNCPDARALGEELPPAYTTKTTKIISPRPRPDWRKA